MAWLGKPHAARREVERFLTAGLQLHARGSSGALSRTFVKMRSMSVDVSALPISLVSLHSLMKFLPSISSARCRTGGSAQQCSTGVLVQGDNHSSKRICGHAVAAGSCCSRPLKCTGLENAILLRQAASAVADPQCCSSCCAGPLHTC